MEAPLGGTNLAPIALNLIQSVPIWLILSCLFHFWLKRKEKSDDKIQKAKEVNDEKLQLTLEHLAKSIHEVHTFMQYQDKRQDATDSAISFIVKDSFSSSMIAKGTGGWPRNFHGIDNDKRKT